MHQHPARRYWTTCLCLGSLLVAMSCQAQSAPATAVSLNPQPLPPRLATAEERASAQEKVAIIIVSGKPEKSSTRKARKWKPVPVPGIAPLPAKTNSPSP